MLISRALFLLRLDERQFLALLFHEPPRISLELNPNRCAIKKDRQRSAGSV
nr:hypothetical protein [Pseudanabaena sp. PCC 6802]